MSHRASAPLWRLPGFEPKLIEISAPRGRDRRCIEGVIVHRVASLERVDITRIDGIPVTTPARTLIDLCSVASREAVEEALDDALRRNLVTVPRLQRRLEQLAQRGRPGIRVMRALLEQRDPRAAVPDSVFERRLLRVLREAGLPPPSVHHRVRVGGRTMVIDFAYVKERIAIEAEGYEWHSGRARFERDLARRNALTALGWQVIHATWQDLTTGRDRFTELIAALLENR